ncbi:THO complex subunit 2 [Orchesella cincta]|uniref:THO complex subunit 2 n=1 Tax=Orchesella cincta TaxID=48709 RepID=A0A1D2MTT4_ORCCI|nr:THO complex subunit 2 [Orchesella cincta]
MSPPPRKRGRGEKAVASSSIILANITKHLKKDRTVGAQPRWITSNFWTDWDRGSKKTFVAELKKYVKLLDSHDTSSKSTDHKSSTNGVSEDTNAVAATLEEYKSAVYLLIRASKGKRYTTLARACNDFLGFVYMERLDLENLQDTGAVNNKKAFSTKVIRTKTRIYYKQQKFNLFREESEGYSKVVSELCNPSSDNSVSYMARVIPCLVGRFNLDPNRVIDLVLEAFECQPNCKFFIPLLQSLRPSPETVCEIIGFKLQGQDRPPESLFVMIALLLQNNVIELDGIYSWLTPDDRVIHKEWDRELLDAREYARKSMIVSINKDKETDENDEMNSAEDRYLDNQKFLLIEALLSTGGWPFVKKLMDRLPEFCLISKRRIALKLIHFVEFMIQPLYATVHETTDRLGKRPITQLKDMSMNRKQIRNWSDLEQEMDIVLSIGPYVHFEPVLMYKLLRIMRTYLKQMKHSPPTDLYYKFLTVLDEVILPGLCFLDANCCIAQEIWAVMDYYPYQHRYRLYGSWKSEAILLLHPSLLRKRVDVLKKVKHLMRRISKENVKPMGRQLGKLSHSMPAVIFDYVLSQIQLFDNLISPVIDALKFLTTLSYDVLSYCLLEALSPGQSSNSASLSVMLMPNRPRTKHDGSTISPWLQSLCSFTGAICKKYTIELVPLLQYVANQLKAKQSLDLLLLKEIVQKMSNIEAAEEITNEQLDALAGGDILRAEAGYFGQVHASKKSASRLRDASSVNDLAVTLCILMAQQRHGIVYDDSNAIHTKLVGKLYDQCQDTLVQFGTFLSSSSSTEEYAKKIPSIDKLFLEYHVSADASFFLWRPLLSNAIIAKYDELRRAEKSHKSMSASQRQEKYALAANHILSPLISLVSSILPQKTWEDITPQFYVTFWSLTLFDLHVPSDSYAVQISRIKQSAASFAENKDMASSKLKKEQDRCNSLIEKLQEEERRQRDHVDRVMTKLKQEKDLWFAPRTAKSAKNETVTAFLQLCLFPRCIFTAPDALYCAHFVNIIHSLATQNFSTLICYDRIFCDIIYTVTSCTENEASRYGRFLCALLGTVMRWHGNKAVFEKECARFPGFVTKFRASNSSSAESSDHVDYENFRHVCHKWHYKITKCVIVCLESKDYIQIRNSLIVLKEILPYFPKVTNLGAAVERWVERVRVDEKDKRQDLFALATSYIGQLKARWNTLVAEEDFHEKVISPEKPVKRPAKDDSSGSSSTTKDAKSKPIPRTEPMEVSTTDSAPSKSDAPATNPSGGSKTSKPTSTESAASSPVVTKKEPVEEAPVPKPPKASSSSESRRETSKVREPTESRSENVVEKSSKSEKRSSSSRPESHSSSSSKKESQEVKVKKETSSSSDRRTSDSDRSRGMTKASMQRK